MINTIKLLELLNNYQLEDLKKALEENAREEAAKKNGTKNKLTIIKNMLKEDSKALAPRFQAVQPCTVNGVNYNAFIDGYRIMADLDNDYGYKKNPDGFRVDKFFKEIPEIRYNIDLADLKGFIALDKANKKADRRTRPNPYIITLEDGRRAGFNPVFLLECLNFCDSNELLFYSGDQLDSYGNYKAPVRMANTDGKRLACLLPVNIA